MKKVHKLGILLLGLCLLAGCFFKPQITKEQQNNVATRIVRNYDVQEIEFISFTKNESTGSYILNVKINNDENKEISMLISDIKFLEQPDGDLLLGPIEEFQGIKRAEQITGKIDLSKIQIKYIGEKQETKMKKLIRIVVLILGLIFVSGCFNKPKLTKEQQNNVVTWIARGYEVKEVEFISFTKNNSTGSYILKVKINNDDSMESTILFRHVEDLDSQYGTIPLNPLGNFESIERAKDLDETASVSIEGIKIKYLGEKQEFK